MMPTARDEGLTDFTHLFFVRSPNVSEGPIRCHKPSLAVGLLTLLRLSVLLFQFQLFWPLFLFRFASGRTCLAGWLCLRERMTRRRERAANRLRAVAWFRGGVLGFVRLLARANEVFDGSRGFDALPLFEFTYPIRNGVHHIASSFARRFARSFCAAWLSVPALGAFHNFYFFLRHTFSGKTRFPLN